jgi:hypothetical protein
VSYDDLKPRSLFDLFSRASSLCVPSQLQSCMRTINTVEGSDLETHPPNVALYGGICYRTNDRNVTAEFGVKLSCHETNDILGPLSYLQSYVQSVFHAGPANTIESSESTIFCKSRVPFTICLYP